MKKYILSIALSLYTVMSFGQFVVESTGLVGALSINEKISNTNPKGLIELRGLRESGYNPIIHLEAAVFIKSFSSPTMNYVMMNYNPTGNVNYGVDTNGRVFANSFTQLSDSLLKENISELQSTLSKVKRLRGIIFDYKEESPMGRKRSSGEENLALGATPEISRQMTEELSRQRIGLLAQEVEQVFPEAVRTLYDGSKGVMYGDLVGVLVEAINELQDSLTTQAQELAALKQEVAAIKSILFPDEAEKTGSKALTVVETQVSATPEPYFIRTLPILLAGRLRLPIICLKSITGRKIKSVLLPDTSEEIYVGDLLPGLYNYCLTTREGKTQTGKIIF